MNIPVTRDQCTDFPGGWCLCAEQVCNALNAVTHNGTLRILEMGCGQGTLALASLLDRLGVPFTYRTYEHNTKYTCEHPSVEVVYWGRDKFPDIEGQYDLIIIDGPDGVDRVKWYPKIRRCVAPGTILLIDDFDHFEQFSIALDGHFEYVEVDRKTGADNWKIVRIVGVR